MKASAITITAITLAMASPAQALEHFDKYHNYAAIEVGPMFGVTEEGTSRPLAVRASGQTQLNTKFYGGASFELASSNDYSRTIGLGYVGARFNHPFAETSDQEFYLRAGAQYDGITLNLVDTPIDANGMSLYLAFGSKDEYFSWLYADLGFFINYGFIDAAGISYKMGVNFTDNLAAEVHLEGTRYKQTLTLGGKWHF
ncbi:hypothetical protein [Salinibius halmophilus]|uniref:hypothetical protein n=1 Tax=Salinibius halmophilus TaxID=1853216 RepID=UPI000E66D7E9|nr:hypothetical protein [Salinibius halmophilus]